MYGVIAIETPAVVDPIPINKNIGPNQSGVAILKNVTIAVRRTSPVQTTCSGKHCDKARALDWCNTMNKGCGCYGTNSLGTSNIALIHHVIIYNNHEIIQERNFSSTKFNNIFMDKPIPSNTIIGMLEQTEATGFIEKAIRECVEEVNDNGGFDAVLWYSRGMINDQSLTGLNTEEEDTQVGSGKITYHLVKLKPSNANFENRDSSFFSNLNGMKFSVGDFL